MSEQTLCEICGEPMPENEKMFKYHGASGPCPKPPLPRAPSDKEMLDWLQARTEEGCVTMCFELDGGVHVTLDPCGGEQRAAREVESVRDGIASLMRPNAAVKPRSEAESA